MSHKICDKLIRKEEMQDGENIYSYELFERQGRSVYNFGLSLYSISISMTDKNGRASRARASDLFSKLNDANAFFDKMVRNLATPIDLQYVIEDELN